MAPAKPNVLILLWVEQTAETEPEALAQCHLLKQDAITGILLMAPKMPK
jgi:hypothetical protein